MDEIGLRAAWAHLKLAAHALWLPVRRQAHDLHVQPTKMSVATRVYLIDNAVLYGIAAAALLLPTAQLHIGITGIAIVDGRLPHLLWGLSVLIVCFSQIAALFTDRWAVWVFTTVGTAMWASAWAVVTLLLAREAGTYAGAVLWLWLVVVHFLFIGNRLVPLPDSLATPHEAAAAVEEQQLVEQFTQVVQQVVQTGQESARNTEPDK